MRLHFGRKIIVILNNAGNYQLDPNALRYLDSLAHSLLRVDATKKQQILTCCAVECEIFNIDTVMNCGYVIEFR